jgi:hypothetical protein
MASSPLRSRETLLYNFVRARGAPDKSGHLPNRRYLQITKKQMIRKHDAEWHLFCKIKRTMQTAIPQPQEANTVHPCRAEVRRHRNGGFRLTIFGIDRFDEEIRVAEFSGFPNPEQAGQRAREWVVPPSRTRFRIS